MAQVMDNLTDKSKRSIIYPFHREGWKTMSGHLVISWLVFKYFDFLTHNVKLRWIQTTFLYNLYGWFLLQVTILPVYVTIHMLLAEPGQSLYFWLRGWAKLTSRNNRLHEKCKRTSSSLCVILSSPRAKLLLWRESKFWSILNLWHRSALRREMGEMELRGGKLVEAEKTCGWKAEWRKGAAVDERNIEQHWKWVRWNHITRHFFKVLYEWFNPFNIMLEKSKVHLH